ncbi:MAG TPA: response regulator transcription factor [Candidatus Limnocylindria bacterium]|jgi:DNA-binding response OmpR family regulator|nr:response regulator transcription factor [Candidatus Limnocylindria bacterium]
MNAAFPRVLVIDDENDVRELLEYGLGNAGFDVRSAPDGRTAIELLQEWTPEALVLDVMLPGIDGMSLIPALRRVTDIPILMLTGKAHTADKVSALTRGADDYIAKPFELEELVARIHAALRRPRMEVREIVSYADVSIDVGRRTATRGARQLELSTREFDLLLTFVRRSEHVFTRTQLLDLVWGTEKDVTPATVETYISYLRAKIDVPGAPTLIQTVRGVGYAFRLERSSADRP